MEKIRLAAAVLAISLLGAVASVASANPVSSETGSNLVLNGDFEAGFTDWDTSGISAATSVSDTPAEVAHSPHHAVLAGSSTLDFIFQDITTTSGAFYNIHIWVANLSDDTNTQLRVDWGGTTVLNLVDLTTYGVHDYKEFVIDPMATAGTMRLTIGSLDGASFIYYDDISVRLTQPQQAPEPASLALFALGLAGVGFSARRRKNNA